MTASTDKLADQLSEYIKRTGDFVLEQAPDLYKDIIFWGIWGNAICCLCVLIGIVVFGSLFMKGYNEKCKRNCIFDTHGEGKMALGGIACFVLFISFILDFTNMMKAIIV